jgi:hypothetical protein
MQAIDNKRMAVYRLGTARQFGTGAARTLKPIRFAEEANSVQIASVGMRSVDWLVEINYGCIGTRGRRIRYAVRDEDEAWCGRISVAEQRRASASVSPIVSASLSTRTCGFR